MGLLKIRTARLGEWCAASSRTTFLCLSGCSLLPAAAEDTGSMRVKNRNPYHMDYGS